MKNPTILKGELSLLRADKSAVITELRKTSTQLKQEREELNKLELKREGVKTEVLEEVARLDIAEGRAISLSKELKVIEQSLKNKRNQDDIESVKRSQEVKLHLGRIKDLEAQEENSIAEVARLMSLFDKNSAVYNEKESNRAGTIRDMEFKIEELKKELKQLTSDLDVKVKEDTKITKDRLKREDKIRLREKNLDARELSIDKREEDLITMSKDMTIVYGRLKEVYSEVNPKVNLDKLILKAI